MSNYTITTDFGAKDSLPSSNSAKVVRGSEFTTEFTNIQTAIATKADTAGDTFTGAVTFDAAVTFNADVTFDTNTLFIDVSANKVGIGTTNPQAPLHVHGDINLGNSAGADAANVEIASLNFYNRDTSNSAPNNAAIIRAYSSQATGSGGYLTFATSDGTEAEGADATEKMRINSSGNVGIGTTSPTALLHLESASAPTLKIDDSDSTLALELSQDGADGSMLLKSAGTLSIGVTNNSASDTVSFQTQSTERMRIDASGNVGIGTSNPAQKLHISGGSTAAIVRIQSDGVTRIDFGDNSDSDAGRIEYVHSAHAMRFSTDNAERMRIDSSGNLLVGKTSDDNTANGLVVSSNGYTKIVRTSGTENANSVLMLNRQSTDGSIAEFRKDDAVVGSIGTSGGEIYIAHDGTTDTGLRFRGNGTIIPVNSNGTGANGTQDLGASLYRFKDIHLSGTGYFGTSVGIGTTSPASTVHIQAPANALQLNNANEDTYMKVCGDRAQFGYRASDGYAIVQGAGSKGIAFGVNNATFGSGEAMRIRPSGKLVIGKTDESVIDTVGIEAHPIGLLAATRDNNIPLIVNRKTAGGVIAQFRKDNTTVGDISVTASATSYNTSSDERLKENIADSADAGSKVDAIQIRQFDWKADGSHQDYGVIAQELVTVAPEAVFKGDTEEDMMGVDYSKLVPMLIKEIQSLRSRVAELENA